MGDEEDARAKFINKLNALYSKKPNNTYLISKYDYINRLQRLTTLNDHQVQRTPADQRLLKNCCIVNDQTNNQLKLCKPGTSLAYVPSEELYDVLLGIHLQLNHAGRNCMQRFIRTRYCNISKDCVMIFLMGCKNCPRTKRMNGVTKRHGQSASNDGEEESEDEEVDIVGGSNTNVGNNKNSSSNSQSTSGANANINILSTTPLNFSNQKRNSKQEEHFSRGQIDLFDMSKNPDQKYSWFLRYTNCNTRKICLRPITTGTVPEISNVLLDIYCESGAPVVLQSLNGREFVQQIIIEINKIYPQCRQLHSEMQDVGILEPDMILGQLYALMKRFDSNAWSGLLRILQFEINSTYRADINSTPFQLTFGRIPTMGLRSSKLVDILYDRSNSADDFMEYLADAELMRMSVFCQQTKTEQTPISRYDDTFGFPSNTYSPISANGIATTSTQIVCTPESLPHSSTSSNNSFYTQPASNTPNTLPPGNTYHSLTTAQQPGTPTTAQQQQQQTNDHFPPPPFDQSPQNHSPNNYFPPNVAPVVVSGNETMSNNIKNDDSMMPPQLNDLQMSC